MYELIKIGFATVDELFELFDEQVPGIESMRQLKNFQRAFTVRELIRFYGESVRGKRILDVGAGFDLSTICCLHQRYGAEACVLDNYDGEWATRGGKTVNDLRREFPSISYIQGLAGDPAPHGLADGFFDAVYSVSVLEHVPKDRLLDCMADIDRMLRQGGIQIHTVDIPLDDGGRKLRPFLDHFKDVMQVADKNSVPQEIDDANKLTNIFLEPPDIMKQYWWPHKKRTEVRYERWSSFNVVMKKL